MTPWPALTKCVVLKPFVYRGRQLLARDQFKHIDADVIELQAGEAKELQSKGLIAAHPAADRFKIGQCVGWKPWVPIKGTDCVNPAQGDPSIFDECWVRVAINGGAMVVCPGYWVEDEPFGPGNYKVYLDEFAPASLAEITTEMGDCESVAHTQPISPRSGAFKCFASAKRASVHPSRAAVIFPCFPAMNSGPQINDRLIALVNASPFRPFTLSLTLCRKWRIGSADQLYPGRRAAPAGLG